MNTIILVGGILLSLFIILYSVKYVVSDKNSLTELLDATQHEIIAKTDLPKQVGFSQNFTYSIWVYVNNWNYNYNDYKPIFGKFYGKTSSNKTYKEYIDGLTTCNSSFETSLCDELQPSPVVTFDKISNDILIFLRSSSNEIHKCAVQNIPLQKWVNLSFTLYKKTLDVYVNGKLHKTCVLSEVPLLDLPTTNETGDIDITPDGGFDGYTSKFQFHTDALNPQDIWDIYTNGYGSLSSNFSDYQIKMALIENGNVTSSITV